MALLTVFALMHSIIWRPGHITSAIIIIILCFYTLGRYIPRELRRKKLEVKNNK